MCESNLTPLLSWKAFRTEHATKQIGIHPTFSQHYAVSNTLNVLHKYLRITKMYLNFNVFMKNEI